jgi:hypothetical protein
MMIVRKVNAAIAKCPVYGATVDGDRFRVAGVRRRQGILEARQPGESKFQPVAVLDWKPGAGASVVYAAIEVQ